MIVEMEQNLEAQRWTGDHISSHNPNTPEAAAAAVAFLAEGSADALSGR